MAIRISGDRPLQTPVGHTTRPTASKVRLAVFNIWQEYIYDSAWLDLCAGSGAMSAEALVRGAKSVVAIEQSGAVCQVLRKNLQKVSPNQAGSNQTGFHQAKFHQIGSNQNSSKQSCPEQNWQVIQGDVLKVLAKLPPTKFDLVYFDPPYASPLYLPVLEQLSIFLHSDSRIAVEHSSAHNLPDRINQLSKYDLRQYGHTALSFYGLENA